MADSDSQVPIFLERLRGLFRASDDDRRRDEESRGAAFTVCVLLSFVLWLSLSLQEQRMVTVDFPVEVGELPQGQALVELPPSTVSVKLQGTGLDLLALIFDPPSVQVAAGEESRVEVQEVLNLPRANDARVESVNPRVIQIETEERVERRLPIRSRLNVRTASSHELVDDPTVTPDSVTVFGARSIVESLAAWPTESLVLNDVRDTVRTTVALTDTLTGLVDRATDEVDVVVRAGKFAVETKEVTVDVTGVPAGQDLVALQPSSIRIRYRVLFDQLFESRRSSEFFATVSYTQIRSDTTGYVEPRIHVPSDLVIRDPEPIPPRLRYYTFLSGE